MEERIKIKELEPGSYDILLSMEKYLAASGLDRSLMKLIKIRASQINKCAFCLEMHTLEARRSGETEQRIYALSAWEESPHFTPAERAALALTEEITRISEHGVSNETYRNMKAHFTDNQIAQVILTISQINTWNRIAVSTKLVYSPE